MKSKTIIVLSFLMNSVAHADFYSSTLDCINAKLNGGSSRDQAIKSCRGKNAAAAQPAKDCVKQVNVALMKKYYWDYQIDQDNAEAAAAEACSAGADGPTVTRCIEGLYRVSADEDANFPMRAAGTACTGSSDIVAIQRCVDEFGKRPLKNGPLTKGERAVFCARPPVVTATDSGATSSAGSSGAAN